MREFHYTVTDDDVAAGLDIKSLVRQRFTLSARLRSKIKRNRTVFLNGRETPVWHKPRAGDVITVAIPEERSYFEPEDIPIRPLYEDEDLLIIDKPAGYVVHPTKGHAGGTIANGVSKYMEDTGQCFKLRFINRLDMDTSGVLLLGKNQLAQGELMKQMKSDKVEKTYLAIAHGSFAEGESGVIDLPLGFEAGGGLKRIIDFGPEGKPSLTHYKVLERFSLPRAQDKAAPQEACPAEGDHKAAGSEDFALVELELKSGRTHQIRVHMAALGHPLVNDFLYGKEEPELMPRQALHALRIAFDHPVSGERLRLEAPLPQDFLDLLERLRRA